MCLSIENPLIQTNSLGIIKNQIQIFKGLREPKALLLIPLRTPSGYHYVPDCTVPVWGISYFKDSLECVPGSLLIYFIPCKAIRIE